MNVMHELLMVLIQFLHSDYCVVFGTLSPAFVGSTVTDPRCDAGLGKEIGIVPANGDLPPANRASRSQVKFVLIRLGFPDQV